MKKNHILVAAAFSLLLTACGGNTKADSAADSDSIATDTMEVITADTLAPAEAEAVDSTPKADAKETAEADNSKELDAEVDKIISKIKENIAAVKDLKDNGIPASSSAAMRITTSLPDWSGDYNKIKGKLSDDQKARIKAEEKKLDQLTAGWN